MIISIDTEKSFDKIQHSLLIKQNKTKQNKNSSESRHTRNIPQHSKSHIQQTQSK